MLSPKPQWMLDEEAHEAKLRRSVHTPLLALLAEEAQPKHPYIAKGLQALQKGWETLPMLLMGTPAGLMAQGISAVPYVKPKVMSWPEKLRNTIGSIEYADKYSKIPELKTKALEHAYKMQEQFKSLHDAAQKEFSNTPKEAGSKVRFAILERQGDAAANAQFWREAIELLEGRGDYLKKPLF